MQMAFANWMAEQKQQRIKAGHVAQSYSPEEKMVCICFFCIYSLLCIAFAIQHTPGPCPDLRKLPFLSCTCALLQEAAQMKAQRRRSRSQANKSPPNKAMSKKEDRKAIKEILAPQDDEEGEAPQAVLVLVLLILVLFVRVQQLILAHVSHLHIAHVSPRSVLL